MRREEIIAAAVIASAMATGAGSAGARQKAVGMPRPATQYKIVFDLNSHSPSPGDINPGLEQVLDILDLYELYGIDRGHRGLVVVLHADTTEVALGAPAYTRLHPGYSNPNAAMIATLVRNGVKFVVSRQSLILRNIDPAAVEQSIAIVPTANLTFISLETEGYVFTSTTSLARE